MPEMQKDRAILVKSTKIKATDKGGNYTALILNPEEAAALIGEVTNLLNANVDGIVLGISTTQREGKYGTFDSSVIFVSKKQEQQRGGRSFNNNSYKEQAQATRTATAGKIDKVLSNKR